MTGQFEPSRLQLRLSLLLASSMLLAVAALGLITLGAFDRKIAPELVNRTHLIGATVRGEVQRALELGIPLESLTGLEHYLEDTLQRFAEVDRITVRTTSGLAVAQAQRQAASGPAWFGSAQPAPDAASSFTLSVLEGNQLVGEIEVATSPRQVQTRLRGVFLDVLTMALVAVLVAVELVLALIAHSVSAPLVRVDRLLDAQGRRTFVERARPAGVGTLKRLTVRLNDHAIDLTSRFTAANTAIRDRVLSAGVRLSDGTPPLMRLSDVADIRLVLFAFAVASEIASAFLPVYAGDAARPDGMSRALAAALPLMCYLGALAMLAPLAERLCRRLGARRLFIASVAPAGLALIGMGMSDGVIAISLWRGVLAMAYACATIACQAYALRAGGARDPLGGTSAFLAMVYAGVFCGATLGGVLAGRFGYGASFAVGAAIAAMSALLGFLLMRGDAGDPVVVDTQTVAGTGGGKRGTWMGSMPLALGVAVPLNATTAVFIWYLTPFELSASGAGPAEVARVVMLYYLATVLVTPLVTRLARTGLTTRATMITGAALSGATLLLPGKVGGPWSVVAAVALLGAAHSLVRAPMTTLALEAARARGGTLTPLRVSERVGAIIGLATSSLVLASHPDTDMLSGLALLTVLGLAFHLLVERTALNRRPSKEQT